jgi:hypothetical protein
MNALVFFESQFYNQAETLCIALGSFQGQFIKKIFQRLFRLYFISFSNEAIIERTIELQNK